MRLAAAGTWDVTALTLRHLLRRHRSCNSHWKVVKAKTVNHLLRVGVNLKRSNRRVKSRHLWNVLVLALALFFLKLERDATNRATLDTPHQVRRETSDLVAQTLRRDNGHLINHLLVGVEVNGVQTGVVLLNENTRSALGGLSADATLSKC